MRRVLAALLTLALVLAACGSDDDGEEAGDSSVAAASDSGAADDGRQADEPAVDDTSADENSGGSETDEPADSPMADDDDNGETVSVSGIDDIPQVCRDLMQEFLEEIEPIVSPIDWDNATINDFEAIAPEFDRLATEFEAKSDAEAQCDDIELDDDENFDLIVEFAGQVAPGTVGFMSFIAEFANAAGATLAEDDATEDMGGGTDAFDDCEGAVAWMQGLIAEYDSIDEAPVADLLQFADLGSFITTCTPEQLEFFDSPEVEEFLSGL